MLKDNWIIVSSKSISSIGARDAQIHEKRNQIIHERLLAKIYE